MAEKPRVRPLLTWPPQYSFDELLIRPLPFVTAVTNILVMGLWAIDPSRCQLLYSSLPPQFQNLYSFCALFLAEATFLTLFCVTIYFSTLVQLLFFSKCQSELRSLDFQLRNLKNGISKFTSSSPSRSRLSARRGPGKQNQNQNGGIKMATQVQISVLRQISREMRELILFIELFNQSFPFVIFAWKILCMFSAIFFYYFAIRHYDDFPFIAFCTGYLAFAITLVYGILYEKAFSIPEKMDELKTKFLLIAQKITRTNSDLDLETQSNKNTGFWPEMKREVKRIQNVGIKVGNFHMMERESTPNFINFVVDQVVSLLVTFPR